MRTRIRIVFRLARIARLLRETVRRARFRLQTLIRNPKDYLLPGTAEYERHKRKEIEHYSRKFEHARSSDRAAGENLFEPAPPIWEEVHRRSADLIRAATGEDIFGHLVALLRNRPGARMASLGSGACGVELMLAREVPQAEYLCLDLNGELLRLGEEHARAEKLPMQFETTDLNVVNLPQREFDCIFCHATLHHIVDLERVMAQMKAALRPDGRVVVVDLMTRNGYRMWPETRRVVRAVWRTLPERFRTNHRAYRTPRLDKNIWEADTSYAGMECLRSQDVLPLLAREFDTALFFPYLSVCRRFFAEMYGWNYDLTRPLDQAILNWIWELDCHFVASGELRAETFFGICRLRGK